MVRPQRYSIYDYPPPRGVRRPFPGTPPLAESFFGVGSLAGKSSGCCVGKAWSHREAAGGQVEVGSRRCFLFIITKCFQRSMYMSLPLLPHYIIWIPSSIDSMEGVYQYTVIRYKVMTLLKELILLAASANSGADNSN